MQISGTGLGKVSNFFMAVFTIMAGALIGLFLIQISPEVAVIFALSIMGIIVWQKWTAKKHHKD